VASAVTHTAREAVAATSASALAVAEALASEAFAGLVSAEMSMALGRVVLPGRSVVLVVEQSAMG
jgi:ADP-ribosylglycohydrolase